MRPLVFTLTAIFAVAPVAGAYQFCYQDQYGDQYLYDINLSEHYFTGEVQINPDFSCDALVWYLQSSFYLTHPGIEFEYSAANPLGDADTQCVAAYMLKGKRVGGQWEFMWYYPGNLFGSQPGVLVPCALNAVPVTGRGPIREAPME